MNEMIIEKLIQKVNTVMEEVMNLNLLVRNLPPSAEMMNQLHTRINAIQASLAQMEKVVVKDNENVKVLQILYEATKTALDGLKHEVSVLNTRSLESLAGIERRLREAASAKEKESKTLEGQLGIINAELIVSRVMLVVILLAVFIVGIKVFL